MASSCFVWEGKSNVETIFHFKFVLHMHASIEKCPALGILCTMTRDEDEDCRDLQKRFERRVLGASLLTAFVGSVIGFTQTSGCPLLAGDPDARWKSPARSGADPEVP